MRIGFLLLQCRCFFSFSFSSDTLENFSSCKNSADRFDDFAPPFRCAKVFWAESACVALRLLSKLSYYITTSRKETPSLTSKCITQDMAYRQSLMKYAEKYAPAAQAGNTTRAGFISARRRRGQIPFCCTGRSSFALRFQKTIFFGVAGGMIPERTVNGMIACSTTIIMTTSIGSIIAFFTILFAR